VTLLFFAFDVSVLCGSVLICPSSCQQRDEFADVVVVAVVVLFLLLFVFRFVVVVCLFVLGMYFVCLFCVCVCVCVLFLFLLHPFSLWVPCIYCTVLRRWSQLVPNMSTDI